ncbi:MAG: hypothetical protein WAT92_17730 [Saprospiraceae bacterium]
MNRISIYYILIIANAILLFCVLFAEFENFASLVGICFLFITFFVGLKMESDLTKINKIRIRYVDVEYSSVIPIFLATFGFYSMRKVTNGIDIIWVYHLLFNIFILSQVHIKIKKNEIR